MKRTLVVVLATAAAAVLAFVVAANLFPDWTWEVLNTARKTKAGVFGEKVPAIEATSQIQPKGPNVPDTCPVTRPSSKPFLLTPPYSDSGWLDSRMFAYGNDQLWVDLPKTGVWQGLQLNYAPTPPAYTQRVIWWRKGYDRHTEPHPNLQIKGRLLDAPAAPLMAGRAEGDRGRTVPDKTVPEFSRFYGYPRSPSNSRLLGGYGEIHEPNVDLRRLGHGQGVSA